MQSIVMQSVGNSFIVLLVRTEDEVAQFSAHTARDMCNRARGARTDGVVIAAVTPQKDSASPQSMRARIVNANATEGGVSANAARCLLAAALEADLIQPATTHIHYPPRTITATPTPAGISVDIGDIYEDQSILSSTKTHATPVNCGNPHLVVFTDSKPENDDLLSIVAALSGRSQPANIHLAYYDKPLNTMYLRTSERGVGPTRSCGSGTAATVFAACQRGLLPGPTGQIPVSQPAGTMLAEWRDGGRRVVTTAPASRVE